MESTLGEKIKNFRKRAGMKQLDLEMAINGSSGFVSRIESDKINPTKETLLNIAKALNLDAIEVTSLFSINNDYFIKILTIINGFSGEIENTSVKKLLEKAADQIAEELDYMGPAIFLFKEKNLYLTAIGSSSFTKTILSMLPTRYNNIYLNEEFSSDNLILRSAIDKKTYTSENYVDFGKGLFNLKLAEVFSKIVAFHKGVTIPLSVKNESLGSILFVKRKIKDYSYEIPVLEALCRQIAITIKLVETLNSLEDRN